MTREEKAQIIEELLKKVCQTTLISILRMLPGLR